MSAVIKIMHKIDPLGKPDVEVPDPPLSDQAYGRIRQDILRGNIAPGLKLKVEELQQLYGFSNTPLREALNRLSSEQLVVADGRRGFRAAQVSVADLRDLTDMRLLVESEALGRSIDRGTDEWEASVISAHHKLQSIEAALPRSSRTSGDIWIERHKDFHMSLLRACGSHRCLMICDALFDQAERYRNLSGKSGPTRRNCAAEHQMIMSAAVKRNRLTAVRLLRRHIEQTTDHVAAVLG